MAGSSQNSNQRATIARVDTKVDMILAMLRDIRDTQEGHDERIRINERDIASLKTQSKIGDGLTAIGAIAAAFVGVFVKPQ